MKRKYLFIATCLLLSGSISAQVTIGSKQKPAVGAILDLKEEADGSSKKGLGMPRVQLQDVDKLKMSATGTEYTDKLAHAGLIVYNISGNPIPKCAPIPDGLYVWDGAKWNGIGAPTPVDPASLDVGTETTFNLPSGRDTRPLIAQGFTAIWSPANPLAYTNTAHTTLGGVQFSGANALPASPLATSPATFNLLPDAMTIANVNSPWQSKETTLKLDATDECGRATTSKTITLNQTNYGLTINGKAVPSQVSVTTSGAKTANIASNAQWKLSSILPAVNPAVTSTELDVVKGSELTDGTAETNAFTYNITAGPTKSRYNYLTFSDSQNPKRFNDVVLTVSQCPGNNDLTMAQYRDLWEEMYGLTPGVDEPNSNGDVTRNTNQVQWHKDQDGNIFFSSMFGTQGGRWMITNLAATSYASLSQIKPVLTEAYTAAPAPHTVPYYGYPNVEGTSNAGLNTQYAARERLGRLYNWAAATGNQNAVTGDQSGVPHGPHQGICPNEWHLPSDREWDMLLNGELYVNPTQYSGNTIGANLGATVKDMCEPNITTSKSFGILDGGFSALLAGSAYGVTVNYKSVGHFWTASSNTGTSAWIRYLETGVDMPKMDITRNYLISVRCKKD